MLYFEKADKVSSTSSTARYFPIKLLHHAGQRAGVVIPVEGVAGSSALYHLYHVYIFLLMWIPHRRAVLNHRPDQTFVCHCLDVSILDLEIASQES